jgi:hypothetical protein
LLLVAALFYGCGGQGTQRSLPPLSETFSKNDKNPFGAYIAYHQVENMFSRNTIRDKKQSFDKTWNAISDTASLYICISPSLYLNEDEVKAMLGYVNAGNSLFISCAIPIPSLNKRLTVIITAHLKIRFILRILCLQKCWE